MQLLWLRIFFFRTTATVMTVYLPFKDNCNCDSNATSICNCNINFLKTSETVKALDLPFQDNCNFDGFRFTFLGQLQF